ncbi:MAG: hypothetical protein GY810_19420 [Aureispira sp.]|nr:hypothetical protein [Aureispira sp.]
MSGYIYETTITVKGGEVVKRAFDEQQPAHRTDIKEAPTKWVETGDDIGKHREGANIVTMDDIYTYAKSLVRTIPKELSSLDADDRTPIKMPELIVYFVIAKNGLIGTAGSRPKGCMDDCFSGYGIKSLRWLSQIEFDHYTKVQELESTLMKEHSSTYIKSLELWETQKAVHNNSYKFSLVWGSFSGYSNTTTITVKNGEIVKRAYKEHIPKHIREGRKPEKWVEKGKNIGKHAEGGNTVVALDHIYSYAECLLRGVKGPQSREIEIDGEKAIVRNLTKKVYFSADNNGLISTIGSTLEGCMDDCFSGYTIRDIKWLD